MGGETGLSLRNDWGPEGPPEEAYGRVTNPERFLPLHGDAIEMIERQFDVERVEGYGLDEELEYRGLLRASINLRPSDPEAAPIMVAFTDFPGLHVRFGKWYREPFPSCGCDACAEDVEGEMERVAQLVESVTAGGFREAVVYSRVRRNRGGWWSKAASGRRTRQLAYAPLTEETRRGIRLPSMRDRMRLLGSRLEFAFDGPAVRQRSGTSLDDDRASQMSGGRRRLEFHWKPWPKRRTSS